MIVESQCSAASANLIDTYIQLGEAIPGTVSETGAGFRSCTGLFPHPVCNFAACLSISEATARELAHTASNRLGFQLYALPMDGAAPMFPILLAAGFQQTYSLVQMVAEPEASSDTVELVSAQTQAARLVVARFMTEQFFSRQTNSFRARISEATARARRLELWCITEGAEIAASVMLCRQHGMLGVYNLCVRTDLRGRGIGSSIVQWVLNEANRDGSNATLQCDERLRQWYEARGFAVSGAVSVFSMDKITPNDIMFRD